MARATPTMSISAPTLRSRFPDTPISIAGSVGYEDGAFGNDKLDWSLGLTAEVSGFTLGASYVDTNRFVGGLGKAGAVFSLSYGF
jgi:hypothetical protein